MMQIDATGARADRRRLNDRLADLPLLEVGLRPFFLLGAAWAVVAMSLWLSALHGLVAVGGPYGALVWHGHEMIYGFGGAILAGFLLTAVPNWTGRSGLAGAGLAMMAALWLAGRTAMAAPTSTIVPIVAALDLSFFALLMALTLRQVAAARNWRNLPVSLAPSALLVGNALVHLEALGLADTAKLGNRFGLAMFILLITVVGGRIIPAFTRNWLDSMAIQGTRPVQPAPFDVAIIMVTALTLIVWLATPGTVAAAALAGIAALGHAIRLSRWQGWRTTSQPLVWILHLAYAWLPIGFGLLAMSALWPTLVPESAALHALTAGVITTMMLAMMTRAALGHTGRLLTADRATVLVYGLICGAAACRVAASFIPSQFLLLVALSAVFWIAAFGLYLASYGPKLLGRSTT